jgi:hypothetical protein
MISRRSLPGLPVVLAATIFFGLAAAPAALADAQTSTNWAGFVTHRSGISFRSASGSWRVPSVTCQAGTPSFSAMWVGIGGYSETSTALEQTGTESDCRSTGKPAYYAWYELVPAPSHRTPMTVHPGDLMHAAVSVSGSHVTLTLSDLTRHTSQTQHLSTAHLDLGSAEWILEAPSACTSDGACRTLTLAHFASAAFSAAHAVSTAGHSGAISSPWWSRSRIILVPGGGPFRFAPAARAGATPSYLGSTGTTFTIHYDANPTPQGARVSSRASAVAGSQVVHSSMNR